MSESYRYADHYSATLGRNVIPMAACLVAGVTLIVLIRRISAAQHERIERGRPAGPVTPGMIVPSPGGANVAGGTIRA